MHRFAGHVVAVTGGANGIGAALTARLVAEQALVWVGDIDVDSGERLGRRFSGRVQFREVDASDAPSVAAWFAEIVSTSGRLDGLAANAGRGGYAMLLDTSEAIWASAISVNLKAAFVTVREAARVLTDGGSIVVTSSSAAVVGYRGLTAYSAAKAGLTGLVRSAAIELADRRIRINCVAPGTVATADNAAELADPAFQAQEIRSIPLARLGHPDDIAAAQAFLLSPDSSWLTGQVLVIDGGASVDAGSHPDRVLDP